MNGLVYEAINLVFTNSGSTFNYIDTVIVSKTPNFLEGVMMPELCMANTMGGVNSKLLIRGA